MTDKEKLKAAQIRFEERHPGLIKKRNNERYMKEKGYAIQKKREVVQKEIIDTKIYIKKIWGKEIPLKKISYKKLRKLSDELGMNTFNVKSFNEQYNRGQPHFKKYTRFCKHCKKYYDIEVKKKTRPNGAGVCDECKKKSYVKRSGCRKIKINI